MSRVKRLAGANRRASARLFLVTLAFQKIEDIEGSKSCLYYQQGIGECVKAGIQGKAEGIY